MLTTVSSAQQSVLNLKANLASPTFTGTVVYPKETMVGLGNVDNASRTTAQGCRFCNSSWKCC
jgi:hypothetical protein